jgi:hypothetical protein
MGAAIRSFHDLGNHIFCRSVEARRQHKLVIGDVPRRDMQADYEPAATVCR